MSDADYIFDESAVHTVYSNVTQVVKSPLDVSIIFSRVTMPSKLVGAPHGPVPVQDVVQIFMSPQHARVLTRLLTAHMEEYTAKFGQGIDTGGTVTVTTNRDAEDGKDDDGDQEE